MAAPVEHIQREIASLETATADLSDQFNKIYTEYLTAFGKAMRQQLVLAAYHICTRSYPDAFLRLSVSQRQKLQTNLREIGNQVQSHLSAQLEQLLTSKQDVDIGTALLPDGLSMPMRLLEEAVMMVHDLDGRSLSSFNLGFSASDKAEQSDAESASGQPLEPTHEKSASDSESQADQADEFDNQTEPAPHTNLGQDNPPPLEAVHPTSESPSEPHTSEANTPFTGVRDFPLDLIERVISSASSSTVPPPVAIPPGSPMALAHRNAFLEKHLQRILQRSSRKANQLLQEAKILPPLPDMVLAAAAESDQLAETHPSPPNVLNVLIDMPRDLENLEQQRDRQDEDEDENEDERDHEPRRVTRLVAINLRLSDIEFADPTLSAWRTQVRELTAKLQQLGKRYQKKLRERAIAEAEAAWRASWVDEL